VRKWRIVILVGICAAALAFAILDRWLRPLDLDTERRAARAAGLPVTPADMPLPRYPPGQDAAPNWKALGSLPEAAGDSPTWAAIDAASVHGVPSPSSNPDLFRFVAEQRHTLGLLHAAASKPGRTVTRAWGPDPEFSNFLQARQGSKMLRLESLAIARQGHPVEAIRNQAVGFRIADQVAQDPVIISYLVAVAVENIAMAGMADIARENPTPAVAAAIRSSIATGAPNYDFVRDVKGETLWTLDSIHRINSLADIRAMINPSATASPSKLESRPSGFMRYAVQEPAEAIYLRYAARFLRAAELPRGRREAAMEAVTNEASRAARRGPAYLIASLCLPTNSRTYFTDDRVRAQRAVLLAGADVLAYRAAHGRYPRTLAEASPNAYDIFSGKPLGYRRVNDGFVVYSVGPDGKFTGRRGAPLMGQIYFGYPSDILEAARGPLTRKRPTPAGAVPTPGQMVPAAPPHP
jgi:hypothetical protein